MKIPHRQVSAARDSTPIRTHSPYSEAEGPIVDRGYVETRVRAIEGAFKQLWAPPSSEPREVHHLPEWRLKGTQLRAASAASRRRRSSLQTDDPFLDNAPVPTTGYVRSIDHRSPKSTKSLQHLSNTVSRSHDNLRSDKKGYSLANFRARYEASPLQGRTRRRLSSSEGPSFLDNGILSPQPILPLKLPIAIEGDSEDEEDCWDTAHPGVLSTIREAQQSDPLPIPKRTNARGLSEVVNGDTEPGRTETSSAWGSESQILEHPTLLRSSSEDDPAMEAHPWSTTANGPSEVEDGTRLKRMRPMRKVPDNTMESVETKQTSDINQRLSQKGVTSTRPPTPEIEPPVSVKRAVTMHTSRRNSGVAAWRAKLRSMSYDQLSKRHLADTGTAGHSGTNTTNGTQRDSQTATDADEEQEASSSKARLSRTRQPSSASASGSSSAPGALRRAWRRWSGWRLTFTDRSSQAADPSTQKESTGIPETKADPDIKAKGTSPVHTPPPRSPKRPTNLTSTCSHGSLNPTAARPTTALSPPEIPDLTPSFIKPSRQSSFSIRPSASPNRHGSTDGPRPCLHHAQSAASVLSSRSEARSSSRKHPYGIYGQPASSSKMSSLAEHHGASTDSTSTGTAYHSFYPTHRNSTRSLRSAWRDGHSESRREAEIPLQSMGSVGRGRAHNRDRDGGQDQRIKRVKVVVSLDGAGDLKVDASVSQPRDGQLEGRVRSFIKRWEAAEMAGGF